MVKQTNADGDMRQIDSVNNHIEESEDNEDSKFWSIYRYTPEKIEEFFDSDNGQEEEHTLEDSICRPLIGKQINKPFFHYCKICSKVEFLSLENIEHHIRYNDPKIHKAKLLEKMQGENMDS